MNEKNTYIIDKINSGEISSLKPFFSSIDNLFLFLEKKDLLQYIDVFNDDLEDRQNLVIYYLLNSEHSEKYYNIIISKLHDVKKEGNDYYMELNDIADLSDFFKSYSRDTSPRDVANSVLNEDYWEPFWDTTNDVYVDVVEDLTEENLHILKNKILEKLKDVKVELDGTSSDEMELIASEQGHDEYLMVTPENIDRIVGDSETMKFLFKNYLDEIESSLYQIHSNAYNDAYNSEYYQKVWDELLTYFDESKPVWTKIGNKYYPKLKITSKIHSIIDDYFSEYKDYGYGYSIDNMDSLSSLLHELFDNGRYEELSFRIHDYPDNSEVFKNINSIFEDYI